MKYLVIIPQLGFKPDGTIIPGGLMSFCRTLVRALAGITSLEQLTILSQMDDIGTEQWVFQMLEPYANPNINLKISCFGGSRIKLTLRVIYEALHHDEVMYALVNQAVLSTWIPWHPPYAVWEIGRELFEFISARKRLALQSATHLLSISATTDELARKHNPTLKPAKPVLLAVEPPIFGEPIGLATNVPYEVSSRSRAVMIVANMHREYPYKGHRQLIEGWSLVIQCVPDAELWIVGGGTYLPELRRLAQTQVPQVERQIHFLGQLDEAQLKVKYSTCRVFAMPSTGEGFGLVFVEAALYGIPAIACKYDAAREVVLHEQTGLLVEQTAYDVAEACVRLLKDDVLAQKLGDAAFSRCREYFQFQHFRQRLLDNLGWEN